MLETTRNTPLECANENISAFVCRNRDLKCFFLSSSSQKVSSIALKKKNDWNKTSRSSFITKPLNQITRWSEPSLVRASERKLNFQLQVGRDRLISLAGEMQVGRENGFWWQANAAWVHQINLVNFEWNQKRFTSNRIRLDFKRPHALPESYQADEIFEFMSYLLTYLLTGTPKANDRTGIRTLHLFAKLREQEL